MNGYVSFILLIVINQVTMAVLPRSVMVLYTSFSVKLPLILLSQRSFGYPRFRRAPKIASQRTSAQWSGSQNRNHVKYCQDYGRDYYKFCCRGIVPDFASRFCYGFKSICPGVPTPGALIGTPAVPPVTNPPAPNIFPPVSHVVNPNIPAANPVAPSQSVLQPNSQLPNGGLQSLPSSPSLPAGGLPSLPSSPSFPSGGLGSTPMSPSGSFSPGMQQMPQMGGYTPGGIGFGSAVGAPFFNSMSGTNISPLAGVGTGTAINAAGIGVGASQGVNFGGLPFLSGINQGLNGLGAGGFG